MNHRHNPALTGRAQELRKEMTREERHLWFDFLRSYRPRFLRQKVIDVYIVDFYCRAANLVIELEGSFGVGCPPKSLPCQREGDRLKAVEGFRCIDWVAAKRTCFVYYRFIRPGRSPRRNPLCRRMRGCLPFDKGSFGTAKPFFKMK